jgi:hypothetical protein
VSGVTDLDKQMQHNDVCYHLRCRPAVLEADQPRAARPSDDQAHRHMEGPPAAQLDAGRHTHRRPQLPWPHHRWACSAVI